MMWRRWSRSIRYQCDAFAIEEHGYTGPDDQKGIRELVHIPDCHAIVPFYARTRTILLQRRAIYPWPEPFLMVPNDAGLYHDQLRDFSAWAEEFRSIADKIIKIDQLCDPFLGKRIIEMEIAVVSGDIDKNLIPVRLDEFSDLFRSGTISDMLTACTFMLLGAAVFEPLSR